MTIDPDTLSSLARQYAQGMTSIRGRRVQRLLKREFAGAEHAQIVQVGSGAAAVLGLSETGAACCATDGGGKHASVVKWRHGSTTALETRFDLLRDSLPALSTHTLSLAEPGPWYPVCVAADDVAPEARALVAQAFEALS